MEKPDVGKILAHWPYDDAAVAACSTAMTAVFSNPSTRGIIEAIHEDYVRGADIDMRARLAELAAYAPALGEHEYTVKLLPYIALLDAAWDKYRERGISGGIYEDSFADLLWKTRECRARHGVYGTAAAFWHWRFFELKCFALGRLQFERVEYEGAPALNVHIPSSGRLVYEDCERSYRRAYEFFGIRRFVCDSWLLHPVCRGLDGDSGIRAFASDYELQYVTDDPQFLDVWNIFGVPYSGDASAMPGNTSLQRLWKEHLMGGGVPGRGLGLFSADF